MIATFALTPPPKLDAGPPVRLSRLLLGLTLAAGIFDLCFWHVAAIGFSLAVFVCALIAIILWNRDQRSQPGTRLILALMAGAVIAAVIETSLTNTLVLVILVIALAGDTYFGQIESPWGRWLSQFFALLFAPGRVFWLATRLLEAAFGSGIGRTGSLLIRCLLVVPALVLALIFGSLLASGNSVFGSWTHNFFDWVWSALTLYLDVGRIALWLFVAFLILPLLRPAYFSPRWWNWTEQMPRLREFIPTYAALFSSRLILIVLNLLFLVANSADVLFLWSHQELPAGLTYSGYVHHGVNSLIVAVILSAFVLSAIFEQDLKVVRQGGLKALALAWIGQNLFLLLSVGLRLKLYIEAYDMTVSRLSVMIFLVLVAVGYILLTLKIAWEKSLSWLIGGCVLAVFGTFYITQFLDLAGWSANYNVAQWEKNKSRTLDAPYLLELGPAAWPALYQVHESEMRGQIIGSYENPDLTSRAVFDWQHWREFSLRAWKNRWVFADNK